MGESSCGRSSRYQIVNMVCDRHQEGPKGSPSPLPSEILILSITEDEIKVVLDHS